MMTPEDILEYIGQNEPTDLQTCPTSGRWMKREWNTGSSTIVEEYSYKNAPTHRQSFAVKSITRKEVPNG